jgi:acetyltransferase-like isoleucine patch superfamily enzyme
MIARIWRRSSVRGLGVSLAWLRRGARVHPRARLDGPLRAFRLAPGAKVAERTVLTAIGEGGIELGAGVWLAHDCELETDGRIEIGAGTTVQRRSSFMGNVVVGTGCIVAPDVFVSSGTHLPASDGHLPDRPVLIGDDCWLGVRTVVMPGVTIGTGAVVGANSVVTRDVAPFTTVAGAPARPISDRAGARTLPR